MMTDAGNTFLEDDYRRDGRKQVQEHTSWTLFPIYPTSQLSDYWTSRHNDQLTRVHVKARVALYTPAHTLHASSIG
eukprot:4784373-Amphidinium_carterae.1